jgi:hypothetical protein
VFSISMTDIEKALTSQKKTDLRTILWSLSWVLNVFDHIWLRSCPLKKEDTDHQIELKEMNEKSQKYSEVSIQHDEREATSVAQDINRTFE